MMRRAVLLLLLLASAADETVQQPPRDAPGAVRGTGSISGRALVEGDPKSPARRVRVTLTDVSRVLPGQTTTTDDRGGFSFSGLPAGQFTLEAFKNAYLRASYGASRPERAGTRIVVADGQAVANLTLTMVRGGVITGTVRDASDRPVPGVTVRVLRLAYNAVTGERIAAAPSSGSVSATDDRGEYRAYGLPPGSYLVLVPAPTSGRSNTPMRRLTSEEVRQALQAARSSTSATPGAAAQLPPAIPGRFNLAAVFHPGVTDVSAASVVSVGTAQERSGIDIAIELVPTATISGTVSSNNGSLPALLSVRLVPVGAQTELLGGVATGVPSTQVQPDGRYSLTGVMPGSYQVKASVGWGRGVAPAGPTQWASADVFVSGEDLVVPLTLQPAVPITGRVLFEGAQPSASELESLSIALIAPGTGGAARATGGGRVDREGRFTMPNVIPDSYRFTTEWAAPGAPDRWTIKSAVANGRETFESPLRVNAAEPLEWTLTFTDTPPTLTGLLEGPGGRAATEYYILVFSADRVHWTPGSRRVGMTRPATDGTFTLKGLPPGDYLLAALLDLENGEWNDPAVLESLAPSSVKVTLREGETTRQNYRMGGA